jgi:hypothetical protein
MTSPVTEFFINAYMHLMEMPEGKAEIQHVQRILNRPIEELTSQEFLEQYIFVVLACYWKEQLAYRLFQRFMETRDLDLIHNAHKRAAISEALLHHQEWLHWIKHYVRVGSGYAEIYIDSLPMMGPVTRYHLARNIGIDCVKPDRHHLRLAQRFGYETPLKMCQAIQSEIGGSEKLGTIDVVLWRWCNLYGS